MDPQTPATTKSLFPQIEVLGEQYFVKKAPFQLSGSTKEWIVKYGPYITMVIIILAIPTLLVLLGITGVFLPFAFAAGAGSVWIGSISALITIALQIYALPHLFKRSKIGWNFLFYAALVSVVGALLNLDLIGFILGIVIDGYFLFQIRSYYS